MFELKTLALEAVPRALAKAERYRLLNEPGEAQSICLDVLAADPDNQEAMATLILALTDQFPRHRRGLQAAAQAQLGKLTDEYSRLYYGAIILERAAKARFWRGGPGVRCCCGRVSASFTRLSARRNCSS